MASSSRRRVVKYYYLHFLIYYIVYLFSFSHYFKFTLTMEAFLKRQKIQKSPFVKSRFLNNMLAAEGPVVNAVVVDETLYEVVVV